MSFSRMPLNGCVVFHSGCLRREGLHSIEGEERPGSTSAARSRASRRCRTRRCAPRAARTGRRPRSVTAWTNFTMLCLAAPSFQDGSGSVCAHAAGDRLATSSSPTTAATKGRALPACLFTMRPPVSDGTSLPWPPRRLMGRRGTGQASALTIVARRERRGHSTFGPMARDRGSAPVGRLLTRPRDPRTLGPTTMAPTGSSASTAARPAKDRR